MIDVLPKLEVIFEDRVRLADLVGYGRDYGKRQGGKFNKYLVEV